MPGRGRGMTVLVTGSRGMIGSHLVQGLIKAGHVVIGINRTGDRSSCGNYHQYTADLEDIDKVREIVQCNKIDRVVHLAALAHTVGEVDLSWSHYYHINVECASNVFIAAFEQRAPLLFISTVDVYGFTSGVVSGETRPNPITNYGKSKLQAEDKLKEMANAFKVPYSIFRFSPVYTDDIKRDIQKRYYLKYPNIAYQIGKGQEYEVLNINRAVQEIVNWCEREPENDIRIIKDDQNMWTPDYIKMEKEAGRAKLVLRVPRWMINVGYVVCKSVFGENDKTYLLSKAVYPLRSE